MSDIRDAIHWWLSENCTKHIENFMSLRTLLGHFFSLSGSLYYALKVELVKVAGVGYWKGQNWTIIGGKHNGVIVNPLSNKDFYRLRAILALAGDMEAIARRLEELSKGLDNTALRDLLASRLPDLKKYRKARNFFAHLEDKIGTKVDTEGVTGELEVPELGLKFSKDAEGCFYFGFSGNTVYFHDKQFKEPKACAKSVSFDIQGMSDMFRLVRDLYDLVTAHTIQAGYYPPSGSIYDFR